MHKKAFTFFTVISILLLAFPLKSKDNTNTGFPYVYNYPKKLYKSGNKNWSIAKNERGEMFYGNSEGLLTFDGQHWKCYDMPGKIVVRAVAADKKGKVYAGGFAEFGYWSYDQEGMFRYTSLSSLLKDVPVVKEEIWKIHISGERVLFQTFSAIYIYEKGQIKTIKAREPFLFLLEAKGRFFIQGIDKGLYEVKGNALSFIPASDVLKDVSILSILPYEGTSFLIGTAKHGVFIYNGSDFKPWQGEANSFLITHQLNNGIALKNGHYAFGTILNGIITVDSKGSIVQHINKTKGLQNNTVLSLYSDNVQHIWAGLDNGIDRVEVNSPMFYYLDRVGKFGTVYASIIHDNKLYLGTNQGLFYSNWNPDKTLSLQSFNFQMVENTHGQVWSLNMLDGQLLCGHNEGTFLIKENKAERISDVKGGWVIKRLKSDPNALIQGTYTGLAVYKKAASGQWAFSHKVQGFGEPVRFLEEESAGSFWVSHDYRGLEKLHLSDSLLDVVARKKYTSSDGLPGNNHINAFNLDGRIVFSSPAGFYLYDQISDTFSKHKELNQRLGTHAPSSRIIRKENKKYWFVNQGKVALLDLSTSGKTTVNQDLFNALAGQLIPFYENISQISETMFLINIDEGFVVYDESVKPRQTVKKPSVFLTKVEDITGTASTISEHGNLKDMLEIPYTSNNIRITYASPYYNHLPPKFQYFLEGYSKRWSDWSTTSHKDFTNLDHGTYRFLVKAKFSDNQVSSMVPFQFVVLPPWYASTWAYVLYGIIGLLLLLLLRSVYHKRLKREQQRLQEKLKREQEEFLRQEAAVTEQKIITLKNEQLKAELLSKSRELATSALNIMSKNELLQSLKDEITHLKESSGKPLPDANLNKIHNIIDSGMSSEQDWELLESSFNEAHENFFKKLKAEYSDLTPNNLKFCAFLRMNMSSKEIAALLNITLRGVEIRRYRLRKKLNLSHDKNLVEFLMEI